MLRLYLVRHAVAEELPEGDRFGDPLRAPTVKGRSRCRRTAREFARMDEPVELICTSPLLRAVQTAELLAGALHHDDVRVLDELRPDAAIGLLLARLAEMGVSSVALVGHKRLLRELAGALSRVELQLKRGTIARLDVSHARLARKQPRTWSPSPQESMTE